VQHHRQALIGDCLGGFIQSADDIRLVRRKVILIAFDLVRAEHKNAPVVFLDQFRPRSFGVILAAFTFDNIPTDAAKTDALRRLRSVLALNGALFLVVSSAAIYVNEWASFSTKDFPENRDARDGDRVHIVMLDVPDRRPVEDVLCTDANYRRLFEDASLELREMRSPLATGQETTPWLSETTTAPWTIYVLSHLTRR